MKKIIISCLVLSTAFMNGCSSTGGGMSKADKRFAKAEYETAIKYYQEDIKKGKDLANANFKIAESYRMSNRLPMAESYYKAAIDAGSKKEEALFNYGLALKANAKYDEAASQFNSYAGVGTNQALVARAKKEAANTQETTRIINAGSNMEVKSLDAINTPAAEYAPYMKGDQLVFTSSRAGKTYQGNGEGFNDIFTVKFNPNDTAAAATPAAFDPLINMEGVHDAAATFSKDGNTMIFARGNTGEKKGALNVDLFISRNKGGVWSEPKAISVNDKRAWDSSPALSADGMTLYFSSDRKGGQGGNDIYKSTLDASGRFSIPENLGPAINTAGNENFPFVAQDGKLYISSDGHAGLGMLDLFRIENNKPVNLGSPINSNADDFAPYITGANEGFFSSNRAGGKGSDDIYTFNKMKPKNVTFYVDGTAVLKEENKPATPAANMKVTLKDANNNNLMDVMTDADGRFSMKLDTAKSYAIVAEQPGYFAARTPITTIGKTPPQSQLANPENDIRLTANLTLNKIVIARAIEVKDINYDYDKSDIRPDAAVRLDTLVQTLMDNPKITIELSSHTDSRGKDDYNQKLSQRRAQSAVDYIVSKGIEKNRITARGYGETRLRNRCKNNVKCTEEEHEKNRRTEFKVTKVAK